MAATGQQPERWLVRVLVTRLPGELTPPEWDWPTMMRAGDPDAFDGDVAVLHAQMVGVIDQEEEGTPCSVTELHSSGSP